MTAADAVMMQRALANAERGWGQTAPNPMVGAVVVSGDQVIADGWHARYGEAHAEAMALGLAGERGRGATLYVTLEPCAHYGHTPPCADAIMAAGIARVVVAVRDPNPKAAGGIERLKRAGIAVDVGVGADAARELNAAFLQSFSSKRPWVTLKMAVSMDGGVAHPAGEQRWITGEDSRREVHRMRANVDAVVVGVGTVLADDPRLTVRDYPEPRRQPVRVVFDSSLRTPVSAAVVQTARETPTIIVSRAPEPMRRRALESHGVQVMEAGTIRTALGKLKEQGIRSILLEGGPTLAQAFLKEKLVDRIALFEAPIELGPAAPQAFTRERRRSLESLKVVRTADFGPDRLTVRAL